MFHAFHDKTFYECLQYMLPLSLCETLKVLRYKLQNTHLDISCTMGDYEVILNESQIKIAYNFCLYTKL